jgi:anthranilate/para-aminobenzoate synthase component II
VIVLIDNYDSFTYNLFQVLSVLGADVTVTRPGVPVRRRRLLRLAQSMRR